MDKKRMLFCLRNPYGIDETELRKARLQGADELERLYRIEEKLTVFINTIKFNKEVYDKKTST